MNLLLSYPRSGNTWYRYCIEYLTKKPTIGYTIPESAPWDMKCLGSFVDLGVDLNADNILIKRHAIDCIDQPVDKFILILRNYKECIIKHTLTDPKNTNMPLNVHILIQSNYMILLQHYEAFSKEKMVIYYEDLITDVQPILEKSLQFLQHDDTYLKSFMENLEYHKEASLNLYGNSETRGKKITHHANKLTPEFKQEWDNYLVDNYNDLFTKYLQRYKG